MGTADEEILSSFELQVSGWPNREGFREDGNRLRERSFLLAPEGIIFGLFSGFSRLRKNSIQAVIARSASDAAI
jgi:hypothetical protein